MPVLGVFCFFSPRGVRTRRHRVYCSTRSGFAGNGISSIFLLALFWTGFANFCPVYRTIEVAIATATCRKDRFPGAQLVEGFHPTVSATYDRWITSELCPAYLRQNRYIWLRLRLGLRGCKGQATLSPNSAGLSQRRSPRQYSLNHYGKTDLYTSVKWPCMRPLRWAITATREPEWTLNISVDFGISISHFVIGRSSHLRAHFERTRSTTALAFGHKLDRIEV
jgi:hypothetical protein